MRPRNMPPIAPSVARQHRNTWWVTPDGGQRDDTTTPRKREDCEESGCGVPAETDRDSRRSRDAPAREYSKHRAGGEHTDVEEASVCHERRESEDDRRCEEGGDVQASDDRVRSIRRLCGRQVHGSPRPSCHIEYEGTSLEKTVPILLPLVAGHRYED